MCPFSFWSNPASIGLNLNLQLKTQGLGTIYILKIGLKWAVGRAQTAWSPAQRWFSPWELAANNIWLRLALKHRGIPSLIVGPNLRPLPPDACQAVYFEEKKQHKRKYWEIDFVLLSFPHQWGNVPLKPRLPNQIAQHSSGKLNSPLRSPTDILLIEVMRLTGSMAKITLYHTHGGI